MGFDKINNSLETSAGAARMSECLTCGSKNTINTVRYFVIPGLFCVPNSYLLCEKHSKLQYYYEDIYDEEGNRKKIDHQKVLSRLEV